ncbi:MAG: hypothetical protein Q4P34_02195 [Tissierellia bacterium]|nr:hypothetical protein [Tissierellia bacterium]
MDRISIKNYLKMIALIFLIIFLFCFFTDENYISFIYFIKGPLMNVGAIKELLLIFTPLCIMGLSLTMIFTVGKINLSSEPSFIIGGLVAAIISVKFKLNPIIHPLVAILSAVIAGAFVTGLCAYFDEKLGLNIIITSLMINYIVFYISRYYLLYYFRDGAETMVASGLIRESARLPRFYFGDISVLIAILSAFALYIFLRKTNLGFKIRLTGANPVYAKYKGIEIGYHSLLAQCIAGALSGLSGALYLLSGFKRFDWLNMPGFGLDAVLISLLAGLNPAYMPISAFVIAYIRTGSNILSRNSNMSPDIALVMEAILIIFILRINLKSGKIPSIDMRNKI